MTKLTTMTAAVMMTIFTAKAQSNENCCQRGFLDLMSVSG